MFSNNAKIEYLGLIYLLNKKEFTASVIDILYPMDEIFIPRSILVGMKEYLITSISNSAFEMKKIKSINFPEDSEMIRIERAALSLSSIRSISIPSKLVDLEDGWCFETSKLHEIKVSDKNPRYKKFNDKMVIGKTSIESKDYDILVFCTRDVEKATIPSFIKKIGSFSFSGCSNLKSIEIPSDSELEIIEEDAFYECSFEFLSIPPHITKICKYAFSFCSCLKSIEIPNNSELVTIEKETFLDSTIERLKITENLVDLQDGWCNGTSELNYVSVDPKNKKYCCIDEKLILGKSSIDKDEYNILVFCARNAKEIKIPSFVKDIGPFSFAYSSIVSFTLPCHITKICKNAFSGCEKLKTFEIPENSELQTIEENAFAYTLIETLNIPSKLTKLDENWCYEASYLKNLFVSPNNKHYLLYDNKMVLEKSSFDSENFDVITFCQKDIDKIKIPKFITKIGSLSFNNSRIKSIEFHQNSEIQSIEQYAFSESCIECFSVPSNLSIICESAFYACDNLCKLSIPENSNLRIIEKTAFSNTSIGSFYVSANLTHIKNKAFLNCQKLQIIQIDENSKIDLQELNVFLDLWQLIIMIPKKIFC